MKKGLGLQANISDFNTTLPQTKHLNFFMGTNPVRYANGGAVRRGVPSSNMNVTQGFLPMALGFDNGGDVSFFDLVTRMLGNYLAEQSGKSPDDPEIKDAAENLQKTNPELVQKILDNMSSIGSYPAGVPAGGGKEPPMPTETATDKIEIGEMRIPENFPDEPGVVDKSKGIIDNVINFGADLGSNLKEQFFPPLTKEEIGAGLDTLLKENEAKNQPKKEDKKEEKKMITAEPDETDKPVDSGISSLQGQTKKGGGPELTKEQQKDLQKTLKSGTGNEGKKDVPSWALPLMSAGFAMMASKSPYFLQALGEAGQEGIATLTAQKEAERAKKFEEAQIEGLKAQAEKDRRSTSKVQIITDEQGRQVYAIFDPNIEDFKILTKDDNTPRYATRSRSEIAAEILDNNPNITEDELTRQINMIINQELGIAQSNIDTTTKEDASGGFSFLDFSGNVIKELFQ